MIEHPAATLCRHLFRKAHDADGLTACEWRALIGIIRSRPYLVSEWDKNVHGFYVNWLKFLSPQYREEAFRDFLSFTLNHAASVAENGVMQKLECVVFADAYRGFTKDLQGLVFTPEQARLFQTLSALHEKAYQIVHGNGENGNITGAWLFDSFEPLRKRFVSTETWRQMHPLCNDVFAALQEAYPDLAQAFASNLENLPDKMFVIGNQRCAAGDETVLSELETCCAEAADAAGVMKMGKVLDVVTQAQNPDRIFLLAGDVLVFRGFVLPSKRWWTAFYTAWDAALQSGNKKDALHAEKLFFRLSPNSASNRSSGLTAFMLSQYGLPQKTVKTLTECIHKRKNSSYILPRLSWQSVLTNLNMRARQYCAGSEQEPLYWEYVADVVNWRGFGIANDEISFFFKEMQNLSRQVSSALSEDKVEAVLSKLDVGLAMYLTDKLHEYPHQRHCELFLALSAWHRYLNQQDGKAFGKAWFFPQLCLAVGLEAD